MPQALALLAAAPQHAERRIGKFKGGVLTRTVVGGRSYDHVRTARGSADTELHPTNITKRLGAIEECAGGFRAVRPDGQVSEHADRHDAARALLGAP